MSVIQVPSKTVPGRSYAVQVEAGAARCQCPGFTYRKTCAHCDEALAMAVAPPPEASYEQEFAVQQLAAVIRYLRSHPEEMKLLVWLAANDTPEPQSWLGEVRVELAEQHLNSRFVMACGLCGQIVVYYSDREVMWPSFQPHDHIALAPEPAVALQFPGRQPGKRPIRTVEL